MSDYSSQIIEHFSNPQNVGEMDTPDVVAMIGNPVCGDQIHLFARVEQERVINCTFLAYGCAASLATASMLTVAITGLHIDEIASFDEERVNMLAGSFTPSQRHCAVLGKDVLQVLVQNFRTGSVQPLSDVPGVCQ